MCRLSNPSQSPQTPSLYKNKQTNTYPIPTSIPITHIHKQTIPKSSRGRDVLFSEKVKLVTNLLSRWHIPEGGGDHNRSDKVTSLFPK